MSFFQGLVSSPSCSHALSFSFSLTVFCLASELISVAGSSGLDLCFSVDSCSSLSLPFVSATTTAGCTLVFH